MTIVPSLVLAAASLAGYPPWLARCTVANVSGPALCGHYQVFEDRAARRGRRLSLKVVVLPASRPAARKADPLFYLEGGPGVASTPAAGFVAGLLANVRQSRDLVFVDLRGTGEPDRLVCSGPAADAPAQEYFAEFLPDDFVRRCREALPYDVALYTEPYALADLDEVRRALGYGPINLFGTSGGTRAAQVYLRLFPAAVRSVVLQGVVPMDAKVPLPFSRALDAGLAAMLDACEADQACQAAFPQLREDWQRSLALLDSGSVTARVRRPGRPADETVRIDRGTYTEAVRHLLYSTRGAARLPRLIHLAATGSFDEVAQLELELALWAVRAMSYGAFLTITCSEDLQFITEADIRAATDGTFLGDYRVRRQLSACRIWGYGRGVGSDFQRPVSWGGPVLLISGAFDTATPPDGGVRVLAHFPRGRHVVFPNQSHDLANPACAAALILRFLDAGALADHELGCVAETKRPPFALPAVSK